MVAKKYRSLLSKDAFLTGLQNVAPSAVVLSSAFLSTNQPSHSPARKVRKLPEPLTSLHHSKYQKMSPDELKTACEEIFANGLKISSEEAAYLEESTRLQSQCLLWFEQRAGRITASMFRKVTRTSIDNPSQSLLSSLMRESKFDSMKVPALRWGIVKEDEARAEYLARASDDHVELMHESAGLHVNPNFPHLGASPDGVVTCECCGTGVLEIKCPFKYRHLHPHSITDPGFCLVHSSDSGVHLSHEHDYYYQVQGQLAVCDVEYCDFICWTPLGFHHERILTDSQFFATVKPVLDRFFMRVMLPRLLTGGNEYNVVAKRPAQPTLYCWCGGEEEGRMVACDNDSCLIEWFHFECVGLTRRPRGKWFCCEECETQSKKK